MLQNFVYGYNHPVGKRALVIGADHVAFSAVLTLKHAGVDVLALVTEFPQHQSFLAYKIIGADRFRVPVLTHRKVTRIIGKKRVQAVEILDQEHNSIQQIECDTIVFAGSWIPDYELSHSGGLQIDANSRGPRVNMQLQTSAKGVFAAGNLIHAAETADVAALSGRHAAHAIRDYLNTGGWPSAAALPIDVAPPIQWVSPQMVCPGDQTAPHGHLIMRVSQVLTHPTLTIWQGTRRLWTKRYRKMIPNLPIYVPDHWLRLVDTAGPIRLEITS
jgi:pyruvate/2-oxoglutarate dehydrogenase complex dihydrolipoamide dehydrogenase (E3) component